LYKPRKISAITIAGIVGGAMLLPNLARAWIWKSISAVTLNPKIFALSMFYNNAQWTFGYSLAFSFIGIIYYLINRSSKRMLYVFCFLELFVLINFIHLTQAWMNIRIFPFFSVFASTLTAQGLWNTIKVFRNALSSLRLRGNIKSYLLQFIIVVCVVYQVFFGIVRGYHATIGRSHSYEDVAAALWLYDNSPENAVILVTTNDQIPYSSILYPRRVIHNQNVYSFSLSEIIVYCSQNHIGYLVLKIDGFVQLIRLNSHFVEIYNNLHVIIFEFTS